MKKTIFYLSIFAALTLASSCKCSTCKHDVLPDDEICKDDFNSNEDYRDAIDAAEDFGYKCTPSN